MLATSQRCLAQRQCWIASHFRSLSSGSLRCSPAKYSRLLSTTARRQSDNGLVPTIFERSPASVAILGGGLTGLTAAFCLTWFDPRIKITIYEASDRLGGWIDSEEVQVTGLNGEKGTVCFQRGARLIKPQHRAKDPYRYDDFPFYWLVDKLGLDESLQSAPKDEVMSKFIYYPDHLVRIPDGSFTPLEIFQTLTTEPLFKGLFPSLARFAWTWSRQLFESRLKYPTADDLSRIEVSVGDHFQQLFGRRDLVDNLLSAVMHGIYGGDVWKLSVQRSPFWSELKDGKYPFPGLLNTWIDLADVSMLLNLRGTPGEKLARDGLEKSAHWFPSGLNELTDALVTFLKSRRTVTFKTGARVTSLNYAARVDRVAVKTSKQPTPVTYEKVVSTLYAKSLAAICPPGQLPSLERSTATTIRVVNLWYPQPGLNHPNEGFGYLIPQSVSYADNPELVLGVLFDSDREWVPDPRISGRYINRGKDTIHGTKLTVMMGGHYWDHLPAELIPDGAAAIELAKKAVARHMGWPESYNEHVVARTKLCQDCIPQHLVGHRERMKAAHEELQDAFQGRLSVAGGSYQSPGVLPSIRAGLDVAKQIHGAWKRNKDNMENTHLTVGDTGLWRFAAPFRAMDTINRLDAPLRGPKANMNTIDRLYMKYAGGGSKSSDEEG
ncbi:putative protoporphyrinogen oxidase [Triangularia setosa]|uniref:Protoporphyrinogen oxidase n=1 Tax=Triangularia setosa TaxID=2587417 RepID=A0AAN7A4V1_9PEZI|nr:putative protoporphyrinogen oxidase [Podospora setosa]